jgi:hypothetical protein
MVIPIKNWKWRSPPSFKCLRRENHKRWLVTNTTPGTPSEATSVLDLALAKVIPSRRAIIKTALP